MNIKKVQVLVEFKEHVHVLNTSNPSWACYKRVPHLNAVRSGWKPSLCLVHLMIWLRVLVHGVFIAVRVIQVEPFVPCLRSVIASDLNLVGLIFVLFSGLLSLFTP